MNNEKLYLNIINNLNDGVYFVDENRRITFWNKAAERISGYTAEELLGVVCEQSNLNHIDAAGRPLCVTGCPLYHSIVDGKQRQAEVFLRHKDGYRIPIRVNIFPITEGGKNVGAIEVFTPNSPTVYDDNLIDQLANEAMCDTLTGLPSRRYLQTYMDYKFSEHMRFNKPFALLFMDIDNFRVFNNEYGHDMGDQVLRKISESVKQNIRKTDFFGRWGGEEFLGIYAVKNLAEAQIAAEKIRVLISSTEIPCERPLSVTASIGITIVEDSDTVETLVERADHLMYKSKKSGKNRVTVG